MFAVRAVYTKGIEERPHVIAPRMPRRHSNGLHVFISGQLAASISGEGLRADEHLKCDMAVMVGRINAWNELIEN